MKKTALILVAVALLLAMCKGKDEREKRLKEIQNYENELVANNLDFTLEQSQRLMELYVNFVNDYPADSLAPEFLFLCASVAMNAQQPLYAVSLYKRIYDEYPEHELRPIALLEQAIVYENIGDFEHAKPLYEQFLIVFPDSPYAMEIEQSLNLLGKSPEEIEFLNQRLDSLEAEDDFL